MGTRRVFGLVAVFVSVLSASCESGADYTTVDGVMLGTTLHVVADVRGVTPQELYAAVMDLDREAKSSMSIFDEGSLLSRLNRNETDSVDRHIAFNLRLADSIGALSDGRYDVTVKPLVEAWGFAGKEASAHPNIDSLLTFVGRDKVHIENGRLVKADPRVQLDFNSVAKGYTVDLLAALVERFGASNYIVDIGGEVRCRGVNREGKAWRIGVETPFDGNQSPGAYVQQVISLSDCSNTGSASFSSHFIYLAFKFSSPFLALTVIFPSPSSTPNLFPSSSLIVYFRPRKNASLPSRRTSSGIASLRFSISAIFLNIHSAFSSTNPSTVSAGTRNGAETDMLPSGVILMFIFSKTIK